MGVLAIALFFATFLAATAAALLPSPWWQRALHGVLVLLPSALVVAAAAVASRRRAAADLAGTALALLLLGVSLLFGDGPGRIPEGGPVSIDLSRWIVADIGLAGAACLFAFGAALARRTGAWGLTGLVAAVLAVGSVQPLLRDLGLPTVGAVGLTIATLAVVAAGRLLRSPPTDRDDLR